MAAPSSPPTASSGGKSWIITLQLKQTKQVLGLAIGHNHMTYIQIQVTEVGYVINQVHALSHELTFPPLANLIPISQQASRPPTLAGKDGLTNLLDSTIVTSAQKLVIEKEIVFPW